MAHATGKGSYKKLVDRLNRFPQGAPPSHTLYKILGLLFSEQEAALVAQLPIKPFTIRMASRIWKVSLSEAETKLEDLAGRAILMDGEHNGQKQYVLPPPMAGFFEFTLMRTRGDLDQKLLAELLHQYLNVEEDFVKDLFTGTETKLGRAFVQEPVLTNENAIHILDYERASHYVRTSSHIGVSMCYCRHKMEHLGQNCAAPMDICLTFNNTAASLIRHGHARQVEVSEGLELLQQAYEHNLVQCGENVREQVSFICNCCGCCCEAMIAARQFGILQPVHTTNYLPQITEACIGCGKCTQTCPVAAIEALSSDSTHTRRKAVINDNACLGCGVCVRACPAKSIIMQQREERIITPVNSVHRIALMAIEKGQLQELIFDNQAFASHRAMAALLSVILKLPPMKQVLASKQLKSVYLDKLIGGAMARRHKQ